MFKQKMKVNDFAYLMINRNFEIDQDIQVNLAVFDEFEKEKLKRYLKLYKMSLAYLYLVGTKGNGEYFQPIKKTAIDVIDQQFRIQIEDLVSVGKIKQQEYELFTQIFNAYKKKIKTAQYRPEEYFFHHILIFSSLVYPDNKDERKKNHLCDYCIQQYKVLNKSFFKKIKLVF